jgi:hypothetical protein
MIFLLVEAQIICCSAIGAQLCLLSSNTLTELGRNGLTKAMLEPRPGAIWDVRPFF